MRDNLSIQETPRPSVLISLLIFTVAVLSMAYLRLVAYSSQVIALTYGLPLLVCLWHKDRRLLWAMAAAFMAMSWYKAFVMLASAGAPASDRIVQWIFQMANILVIGASVHLILNLNERLTRKNAELESANQELSARQELISRQNDELQAQSEELAQQNEELQQQSEELARQNEELQQQSEELEQQSEELQGQAKDLQSTNAELNHREAMLQTILESVHASLDEDETIHRICEAAVKLIGEPAAAAAVVELEGDQLVVRTHAGSEHLQEDRWGVDGSFAAVVMEQERTAFVDDLSARPDLKAARSNGTVFRSVLATPLRLNGKCCGAIKIYSAHPQHWTAQQFRIIEWVSAQCSFVLEILRLRQDLSSANVRLEKLVTERTAELQEMVSELEHFSYTITHDMRAPLRAMQGFAALLGEIGATDMNPEMKLYLERIVTSATRMDRLITDALSYSKAVQQELAVTPVDCAKLLQGIIQSYPDLQPPKADIQIQGQLPHVLANEAGLTQCFSNLLGNAVKFVEPGKTPHVLIRADSAPGVIRLWIEDDGIGIPREMRPRMFQMFQRASRKYEGTGIGLALVRKVAARMGGRVGVESEPGKGSRFWLELPAAESDIKLLV